jgi:hypothetical protein
VLGIVELIASHREAGSSVLRLKIRAIVPLTFRGAESAHEKDDKAYQQNQTKSTAADDGTTKVKPAAAEQEKKNNYD